MPASTPEVTGKVRISLVIAEVGEALPEELASVVRTWVRAIQHGFFGAVEIRVHGDIETEGWVVSGSVECHRVPRAAFRALSKLVSRFAQRKMCVVRSIITGDAGQRLGDDSGATVPVLPPALPFTVEYPKYLRREVRVEIEFCHAFSQATWDVLLEAFHIWDVLVDAIGDPERSPDGSEYAVHRLSPSMIEHEIFGYIADFECLDFIVWLALRWHQHQRVERVTLE